ncbi:hypothetical protein PV10_08758 [Exophiala mesophila]|uniref:Uncharacterized protein n=1 Tax=Exophiala mesophila TaxID=212818 RepID=A0A0D1Z320_EXOME|nr:uncharacterized protein PV10_08758 [Exophiala mesophila]KIV89167.1 hypothetical protein PV10_08758 [Exophiala mesophila]
MDSLYNCPQQSRQERDPQRVDVVAAKMSISLILNDNEIDGGPQEAGMLPIRRCNTEPSRSGSVQSPPLSPCLSTASTCSERSSSSTGKKRHPPRQGYTNEQALFIWWHRDDKCLPWSKVERAYQRYFGYTRKTGGLQCKYYRILDRYGVVKVRDQKRWQLREGRKDPARKFGMEATTKLWFCWMDARHLD